MPPRNWRYRVEDMLNAIERIERYTAGIDRNAFLQNSEKIDAVVHNIITIGEAANHMPESVQLTAPHIPWRAMRGMRNFLVHVYWQTEAQEAWKTVQHDLPPLRTALKALLDNPPDQDVTLP